MWDTIVSTLKSIVGLPSAASAAAGEIGVVWATVTNYRMWRSLGWLLLGILMIILALVIWNRGAIGKAIELGAGAK